MEWKIFEKILYVLGQKNKVMCAPVASLPW